jgi:pimeloyl-ACP methyl ester carboxylesterase
MVSCHRAITPIRAHFTDPGEVALDRMRTDGIELEYQVRGNGEPVIFIHGAFIADTFRPVFSESSLTERYRLILYHRRGYGGSSRTTEPVSINQQAADCEALLHHLGVERAHVVGHSYGGSVALQLAQDNPDMVHSLALLEPAMMVGESARGYRDSLAQGIERYRESDPATIVDETLRMRWPEYRNALDRALPEAFDQAVVDAETSFEYELSGLMNWQFGEREARRIKQPALSVLGGRSEALWPRFGEVHRLLLTWLPNAEAFIVPGTTHFFQIEDPRCTAEGLAAFWARHPISTENT